MRRASMVLFVLLIVGCGSGGGGSGGGTTTAPPPNLNPVGKYTVTFAKTSGTCSDLSASTVTISQVGGTFIWTETGVESATAAIACEPNKCTAQVTLVPAAAVIIGTTLTATGDAAYAVTITSTGLTGTASLSGKVNDTLGRTVETCSATYSVLGAKGPLKPEGVPIPSPFEP